MIASLVPGARAMLRRLTDLGGTTSFDEVQQHFAIHPTTSIATAKVGGTLTSIKAAQRHVAPTGGTSAPGPTTSIGYWWKGSGGPSRSPVPAPTCCAANPPHTSPDPGRIIGRRTSRQR